MDTAKTMDEKPAKTTSGTAQKIRGKFFEIYGIALTLPDEMIEKKFSLTPDGDLVMILR